MGPYPPGEPISESTVNSIGPTYTVTRRDKRLYLDEDSIAYWEAEAAKVHLSFSAFLRVWKNVRITPDMTFQEIRIAIATYILEHERRV